MNRLARRLSVIALILVTLLVVARIVAGQIVASAVRDRVSDVAGRAGFTASVGDVSLSLDGTVDVYDVELARPDVAIRAARLRVDIDVAAALTGSTLAALEAVDVAGAAVHFAGSVPADEVLSRLRSLAKDLRARTATPSDVTLAALRELPPVTVRDASVATDERTLVTLAFDGAPDGRGGYRWTATGVTNLDERVGFEAHGVRRSGEGLGSADVTFQEPLTVPGPRGTKLSGITNLSLKGGRLRTGRAILRDRSGGVRVETEGADFDLNGVDRGDGGETTTGSLRGTVIAEVQGHEVRAEGVQTLSGGRRILAGHVVLGDDGQRVTLDDLDADLRAGRVSGGDLVLDAGEVTLRADRFSATGDLHGEGPIAERLKSVRLDGVRVVARGVTVVLPSVTVEPKGGGYHASGKGLLNGAVASFDLDLDLPSRRTVHAKGNVRVVDLVVDHWRLAPEPLGPVTVDADFDVSLDLDRQLVDVDLPRIAVGPVHGALHAGVRGFGKNPRLDLRLTLPKQRCDRLVQAVPRAMLAGLPDLRVDGEAWLDARLKVDLADTHKLRFDVDGSLDECRLLTLGKALDRKVAGLSGPFVHRPEVDGEQVGGDVGPGTQGYVPLASIPRFIPQGAMATEDLAFYKHKGFRASLIRGALKLDLEYRRYVYGGSTITQQLVKNLFLTRRKDLARKLEEAVLVVAVERALTKDRILELYLNCIEYGPGIWGLATASQAYFGKRVEDLDPTQGLYLMALKPYPKHGWHMARSGQWPANWVRRMGKIMTRVHKMGGVSDEQLAAAAPDFRPTFSIVTRPAAAPAATAPRRAPVDATRERREGSER